MIKLIKVVLSLLIMIFLLAGNLSAIDIQLDKKEVEEAVKNGVKYGKEIFKSPSLKHACISFWPREGGVLVRSKYVDLTVSAAMRSMMKQKISDKEIREILNYPYLKVQVRTKGDMIISLEQGNKIIEPDKKEYTDPCCELCKFSGGNKIKHEFVTACFPYKKLNPNAKTTIIIREPFSDWEFDVDFSEIK